MEALAVSLWKLADYHEKLGDIAKTVECLEAICQNKVPFFPIIEVKTRIRIATILLHDSHNVNHAKSHLQRCELLLKNKLSFLELRCRVYSLLSQCCHLGGDIKPQIRVLRKALRFTDDPAERHEDSTKLWSCNFNSQLAKALSGEGDYKGSISALERGYVCATEVRNAELQMFFATSILHVQLMQWDDNNLVEQAVNRCNKIWESIEPNKRRKCTGLLFYNELLHVFYRMRLGDCKNAAPHVDNLDAAMKFDMWQTQHMQQLVKELDVLDQSLSRYDLDYRDRAALSGKQAQIKKRLIKGRRTLGDKLLLAPPPIGGEWLPKSAVYALVDLIVVVFGRPKGLFMECGNRIQSGMRIIQDELVKLGITDNVRGVYLMLLIQFLENKVAIELTRADFAEAQKALVQMKNWFMRFPTILQSCECIIEMLRGKYAHSVGCYDEAAFHYIEAVKLTDRKSMQAMCQVYAVVSYISIGDAKSFSQAHDLIFPLYEAKDSFVGVREKANILFAYGILLMKQQDLQQARICLAKGLQLTHNYLEDHQLISQYLTTLGSLLIILHDTTQAKELLRSSLTLSKKLCDVHSQVFVLPVLTALYKELGERGNENKNVKYQTKISADLQKRLADGRASIYHIDIIDKVRFEVQQLHKSDIKHAMAVQTVGVNLDILESFGLPAPSPIPSSSLVDIDDPSRTHGEKTSLDISESSGMPAPSPVPSSRLVDIDDTSRTNRKQRESIGLPAPSVASSSRLVDIDDGRRTPEKQINLDISESIGLPTPSHVPSSKLVDIDGVSSRTCGKRKKLDVSESIGEPTLSHVPSSEQADIDSVSSGTPAKKKNLGTPKSAGLPEPSPIPSSRLVNIDGNRKRRAKRRI